jgi:hypothetical protein
MAIGDVMTAPDQPQYQPVGAPVAAPAPKAKGAVSVYVRLADLIVAGGAVIILLFSWAPMVGAGDDSDNAHISASLWGWLSPLGLFVLLAALGLIATAAVDTWWHREKPMVGLHRHHVQVGMALFALVVIFGMCFANPYDDLFGSRVDFGVSYGGIIQLLGALIAAAGAVLNFFNQLQNPIGLPSLPVSQPPAYQPPAPQGYPLQPQAPGVPQQGGPAQPYTPPTGPGYPQAGAPTVYDANPAGNASAPATDQTQPIQPPTA